MRIQDTYDNLNGNNITVTTIQYLRAKKVLTIIASLLLGTFRCLEKNALLIVIRERNPLSNALLLDNRR